MLRHLLGFILFLTLTGAGMGSAFAAAFEVTNIKVSTQSENAVKARDQAIAQAQRIGFAALINKQPADISAINDVQIDRLMRGFSVQGERVAARAYAATFTIRFNPGATQNFASANGFSISPLAQQGSIAAVNTVAKTADKQPLSTQQMADTPQSPEEAQETREAPVNNGVVVLPVLDIGTRRTLWDEPNPWRDTWQKGNHSVTGNNAIIPLGDIDDVTDVPDTSFLTGTEVDFQKMLDRYQANKLFVALAKNQSDGTLVSVYVYQDQHLGLLQKQVIHPRPGFLFDDAVAAATRMMNGVDVPVTTSATGSETSKTIAPMPVNGSLKVTIPYQSLPQWVAIQKRLRLVNGVRNVMPIRMSPSSAQVKISTSSADFNELQSNMAQQGFDVRQMPDGEIALTEK